MVIKIHVDVLCFIEKHSVLSNLKKNKNEKIFSHDYRTKLWQCEDLDE